MNNSKVGKWVACLVFTFYMMPIGSLCAQVQFFQSGNSLFVIGGADDDNVGFGNWNGDVTQFRIFDYVTSPATPYYFSGVENLFFVLGDGDNRVQTGSTVSNTIVGDFEIATGDGIDRATLSGTIVGGNAQIDLGDGDSTMELGHIECLNDLSIFTGNGSDQINLGLDWDTAYGTVHGNMTVQLGSGAADSIRLFSFICEGHLNISGQGGGDVIELTHNSNGGGQFGKLTISGGWGADIITVEDATIDGDLVIDSANGADRIYVGPGSGAGQNPNATMEVGGQTSITTGNHGDELTLNRLNFYNLIKIDTGAGNDEVDIIACKVFDQFICQLGGGSDDLLIDSGKFDASEIYGNNGFDTGNQFDSLLGSPQEIKGFESGNLN